MTGGPENITNMADGHAKVDAQIGVVNGDAVFHRHETIYKYSADDTPERRYRVARNHIDGGSPRAAEKLLGEVLREGLVTTEVAYYYAIAVLSERSLSHLGPAEFENFDFAIRSAHRFPEDGWTNALGVIGRLMACVSRQETGDDVELEALAEVLDGFESLPRERRSEISRHLDMLLDGAIQDQIDRVNADLVEAGRHAGERTRRAWMFFQPDPAEPRRNTPYFHGEVGLRWWVMAVLGALGFLGALVLGPPGSVLSYLWGVLVVAGAGVAWWYGSTVVAAEERRKRLDHEYGIGEVDRFAAHGGLGFRLGLVALADARFRDPALRKEVAKDDLPRWYDDMSTVKHALVRRLTGAYGVRRDDTAPRYSGDLAIFMAEADVDTPRESDMSPAKLNWLIRWHARRAARKWREGTLFDYRERTRADTGATVLCVAGTLASVAAAVGLLMTITMPALSVVACVVGMVAGAVCVLGAVEIRAHKLAVSAEEADCDALYAEEMAEYERWVRKLADRPTDAEMASWLDFDKAHLKTTAMRHSGLTNRDIIAHVVLTEGAPNAKRARVIHGPPRYSAYVVLVFLLTEGGVRVVEVDLDFEDGAVHDERRTAFRYDAMVSAKVAEVGVRFAGERRQVVVVSDNGVRVTEKTESLVLSRAFRLSLGNGDDITVLVENFDGILDESVEDRSRLVTLALDTSGVTGALRILESIAAEGREWLRHERERRDRRWRDWARSARGRAAIAGGMPALPAIPPRDE